MVWGNGGGERTATMTPRSAKSSTPGRAPPTGRGASAASANGATSRSATLRQTGATASPRRRSSGRRRGGRRGGVIDLAMRRHNSASRAGGRSPRRSRATESHSTTGLRAQGAGERRGRERSSEQAADYGGRSTSGAGGGCGGASASTAVPRVPDDGGGGARPAVDAEGGRGLHAPGVDLGRLSFQFGGRVENNRYRPSTPRGCRRAPSRVFRGRRRPLRLWEGGVSSHNYTTPTAPGARRALQLRPHIGTLTFEVGNAGLRRERGDGVELALATLPSACGGARALLL